jgi:hypothetical protein
MPRPTTIKDYATKLLCHTVRVDGDGRHIGYDYGEILKKLKRKFPASWTDPPPWRVNYLYEIARHLNHDSAIKMPVRPRKRMRKKSKVKS